jgi:hypothetical protein
MFERMTFKLTGSEAKLGEVEITDCDWIAFSSAEVHKVFGRIGDGFEGVKLEFGVVEHRKIHRVASKIASTGCGSEGK